MLTDQVQYRGKAGFFNLQTRWVIAQTTQLQGSDKNFHSAPSWLKLYMPTAPQSTLMDQSYSISIEGLNHVVPKWSHRSSKVGHLVFTLGQW